MDEQRQDDQLEPTYNSCMPIQDVALKTYRKRWTIEKVGARWSGRSALVARHDDDININFLFIFVLKCHVVFVCFILLVPRSSVLRKAFEFVQLWISRNENNLVRSSRCLVLLLVSYSLFFLSQDQRRNCSRLIFGVSWKTIFIFFHQRTITNLYNILNSALKNYSTCCPWWIDWVNTCISSTTTNNPQ